MKWVELFGTHINVNQIQTFYWKKGTLCIFFCSCDEPVLWDDLDRQLYIKLCHQLGVRPWEEVADGD